MNTNVLTQYLDSLGASYIGVGSGERFIDDSGNGNNATLYNGASTNGLNALSLDGSDDYADIATSSHFDVTSTWTFVCAFNVTAVTANSTQFICTRGVHAAGASNNGFNFAISGDGSANRFLPNVITFDGVRTSNRLDSNILSTGTDHLYVVTYDHNGGAPVMTPYLDGTVRTTSAATSLSFNDNTFDIGQAQNNIQRFGGSIGPIALIKDTVATTAQILEMEKLFRTHPTSGGGGGGG